MSDVEAPAAEATSSDEGKQRARRHRFEIPSDASSSASAGAAAAAPARQLPRRSFPTASLDSQPQPSASSHDALAHARATAERDALLRMEQRIAEDFVVNKKCFVCGLGVCYFV